MNVGITEKLASDTAGPFDVSFHAWAEPSDADPLDGVYPFIFETPDGLLHRHLSVPARVPLSLSAFAHELSVFASEEDFDASQTGEVRYAAQSFIPSGLFSPDLAGKPTPSADAIFSGVVRETRPIRNPITGREILWALTDTLGGSVDVVVDPALVTSPITAGGVISGSFWLSGRFPQAPVTPKGLLSRLVARLRPSAYPRRAVDSLRSPLTPDVRRRRAHHWLCPRFQQPPSTSKSF